MVRCRQCHKLTFIHISGVCPCCEAENLRAVTERIPIPPMHFCLTLNNTPAPTILGTVNDVSLMLQAVGGPHTPSAQRYNKLLNLFTSVECVIDERSFTDAVNHGN